MALRLVNLKSNSLLASMVKPSNEQDLIAIKHLIRYFSDSKSANISSVHNDNGKRKNHSHSSFGLFFDIDGVLVRGKKLLPRTRDCLKMITDPNGNFVVPTVFLTNAGNEMRASKATKLSSLLGVDVKPEQVVMSHSPLKIMNQFHNKRCLISGQGPIIEIAKNLGFKSVITVDELRQYYPQLDVVDHKRRNFKPCVLSRYFPPIEAIILFGESIRWETNLQLLIDVLMCNGKLDSKPKAFPNRNMPVIACNADMVWMAEAQMPRFGHGTFLHCLEQVYKKLSGNELEYSAIVGKPSEVTYYYAENVIQAQAKQMGLGKIERIYAVGDNLDTDIYGANLYNQILENNNRQRDKMKITNQYKKVSMANSSDSTTTTTTTAATTPTTTIMDKTSSADLIINELIDDGASQTRSEAHSIKSILVRTGVYQADEEQPFSIDGNELKLAHKDTLVDNSLVKPHFIANDVYDAVQLVFELENLSNS
jgi:HAD superfamily hydrolase (TIGR01456 family)